MNIEKLDAAALSLGAFASTFERDILPAIKRGSLPDACRSFKTIRDAYDKLDEFRKALNTSIEDLNRNVIPEMMAEAKTTTLTVECEGGIRYRFNKSQRVSCSMGDKEGGMRWLRESGNDGIIQETVNSSTLAGFAKDWVQNQGKDLPPEFFKINTMNIISVTKA